jgi:(1->4)-alpha-D-glucan 1-alpha-D-glucosylmutase
MKSYNPPSATYRLQFHEGFTFKQLEEILGYLQALGISTVYASPVFKASPGSQHGYDVTDPHQINPEIGTIEQLRSIHQQLEEKQMTWLQDIVPNHMAFHTTNTRLYDVLERGPLSPYYEYFDIDWQHPDFPGMVIAPFLGKTLEECVNDGEIKLQVTANGFTINYFENVYPLSISAYDVLLTTVTSTDALPINQLITSLYQQATIGSSAEEWTRKKQALLAPLQENAMLSGIISRVNNNKPFLLQLVKQQYYLLSKWSVADQQINYRRFFTVNELITLKMESPQVFDEYHTFLHSLYRENLVQGLRIDHIDGLREPAAYVDHLRRVFGSGCYIIAEKILESHESLPADWSLQGTSGYEFLSYTNHVLSNDKGAEELRKFYDQLVPGVEAYEDTVFAKKKLILERYMGGEHTNLVRYCYALKLADARINQEKLKEALGLFMICLPVYRLYPSGRVLDEISQETIKETFERARARNRSVETEMALLESLFEETPDKEKARNRTLFIQRLMQFTGPLTAKGVEDTTFYVYNPLLSFNEVGDSPGTTSFSVADFHKRMLTRQQHTPQSLNTTATHDTKRGEDARIRINMLTLVPEEWKTVIALWREMNQSPLAVNDEYFVYQSIIAGFPGEVTDEYIERLQQYFLKAVRESKVNTSWSDPVKEYEDEGIDFIERILRNTDFITSVKAFLDKIAEPAMVFSLAQTLIKITAPGIPDVYQGCELWDLSYVDPDNRRPVDYGFRTKALADIQSYQGDVLQYVQENRALGYQKLFVTWKALHCRKEYAELFVEGDYLPLQSNSEGVLAYARAYKQQWVVVIVPLPGGYNEDAAVLLPKGAPQEWKNVFTGETVGNVLKVKEVLKAFPVAMLTGQI